MGKKDVLKPIRGKKIKLFVCGPTVYDFLHIGNARVYVVFDSFVKFLKKLGYKVFYLQNITDIDDKIILRSREKEVLPQDLSTAFEKAYLENTKSLNITSVSKYARATDYIKEIISQVERLIEKDFAYKLADGIYFDISKFKDYGRLSGRTALQAEDSVSRIDYSKDKRNRGDFCLWKYEQPGEPSWDSPFGKGRPGWHIEDTAITEKFFGPQYDIHGAGVDLMFPHHEAEITQMEAISGKKPLAKYWMHVGFLTINDQKMAKSAGVMITINDFLKRYSSQQLRFLLLKNLWRNPLDFSESTMFEVRSALDKIEEFVRKLKGIKQLMPNAKTKDLTEKYKDKFYTCLADDFNTPKAFAVLFDMVKDISILIDRELLDKKEAKKLLDFIKEFNGIFGIIDFKKTGKLIIPKEVLDLLKQREQFRKEMKWDKADEVRKEIEKYRYTVEDTKDGPVLKKM